MYGHKFIAGKKVTSREATRFVRSACLPILGPSTRQKGLGTYVLFPLTAMRSTHEFISGVFSVIAPNAQARLLVTPKNWYLGSKTIKNAKFNPGFARRVAISRKNLLQNFDECIGENCRRLVVVDSSKSGSTFEEIANAARLNPKTKSAVIEFQHCGEIINFMERFIILPPHLGWVKDTLGKRAGDIETVYTNAGIDTSDLAVIGGMTPLQRTKYHERMFHNIGVAVGRAFLASQKKES
jgi:hypothetical protein